MASRLKGSVDRTAIAIMFGAMTLLTLFLTTLVPVWARLALVFLSGIFIGAVMAEEELQKAIALFVVCSIGGMLLTDGLPTMAPYLLFCGWYAIAKYATDGMHDRLVAWCIKFMIYNISMAISCYFFPDIFQPFINRLPMYLLIPLAELALPVYDGLIWLFGNVYRAVWRRHL